MTGAPWKCQGPRGRGRDPLGAAGIHWKWQGPSGSGSDPLGEAGTLWEEQGPLEAAGGPPRSVRDPLEEGFFEH